MHTQSTIKYAYFIQVLFSGMATDKTVSFPVRIPKELDLELQTASDLTSISKQDLMRLCLRIGLIDLKAAEHDLPGTVKRIADDAGVSFTRFAKHQSASKNPFYQQPKSPDIDSFNAATFKRTEDILSGMLKLNESPASPPVTEPRTEVTYVKKPRSK